MGVGLGQGGQGVVARNRQPQAAVAAAVVAILLWLIWTRLRPTPPAQSSGSTSPSASRSATATTSPTDPELLATLTSGATESVGDLRAGSDDTPGVFTLWIDDNLVYYGRGSGVAGRARRVANQPGGPLQRRVAAQHPALWSASTESSDQKRASQIIKDRGRVRLARFESSDEAEKALDAVSGQLDELVGD